MQATARQQALFMAWESDSPAHPSRAPHPPLSFSLLRPSPLVHSLRIAVRGDLIRILQKLLKRKHRFDAILIETTGLADPAPVAQTFFVDDSLKVFCCLLLSVAVVLLGGGLESVP